MVDSREPATYFLCVIDCVLLKVLQLTANQLLCALNQIDSIGIYLAFSIEIL